jgi:hypothetical protein
MRVVLQAVLGDITELNVEAETPLAASLLRRTTLVTPPGTQ